MLFDKFQIFRHWQYILWYYSEDVPGFFVKQMTFYRSSRTSLSDFSEISDFQLKLLIYETHVLLSASFSYLRCFSVSSWKFIFKLSHSFNFCRKKSTYSFMLLTFLFFEELSSCDNRSWTDLKFFKLSQEWLIKINDKIIITNK